MDRTQPQERTASTAFYRLPKYLFQDQRYHGLSGGAMVLYALLLDRKELSQRNGIVLSLGGGAVLRPENVEAVRETGLLIHLDTPYYRILKNLSYSNTRPLLDKPDKQAETRRLYNARKAIYHRVSDVSVRSPKISEVLEKVVKSI